MVSSFQAFNYGFTYYNLLLLKSIFATVSKWTSSGPSAIRSVRAPAYNLAKGES